MFAEENEEVLIFTDRRTQLAAACLYPTIFYIYIKTAQKQVLKTS